MGRSATKNLARAMKGCELESLTPEMAKRAGTLCGLSGTSDIVDATIVVSAATRGDTILTTDFDDLAVLAAELPTVQIVRT